MPYPKRSMVSESRPNRESSEMKHHTHSVISPERLKRMEERYKMGVDRMDAKRSKRLALKNKTHE